MASFFLRECNQIPLGTLIEAGEWRGEQWRCSHTHAHAHILAANTFGHGENADIGLHALQVFLRIFRHQHGQGF